MVKMRESGFLRGKRYSGPPPPSLNVDRPGGSGIQYGPLISVAIPLGRSDCTIVISNSGPPPPPPLVKFRKVGGAPELF
jgi:hypothetical protein